MHTQWKRCWANRMLGGLFVTFSWEASGMLDPLSPDHYRLPQCIVCDELVGSCLAVSGQDRMSTYP